MGHLGVKSGNSFRLVAINAWTRKQKGNITKTGTKYKLQRTIRYWANEQFSVMHVGKRPLAYIAGRCSDAKTIMNIPPSATGHNVNASTGHTEYSSKKYSFDFRADYLSAISYIAPSSDTHCVARRKKPIIITNFKGTRQCNSIIYLSIYLSVYLWLYSPSGPWPLLQFLNLYPVGRTPWTGEQPVARPLPTHWTTQTQNKRIQISMPIYASSRIRTHDPSVRAGEDGLCLRPRGHRDRLDNV
jgi:hypothetical protein